MKAKDLVPKLTLDEIMKTLFYFYLSGYLVSRSFFFISVSDEVIYNSGWYQGLAETLDIRVWSVITIVAGLLIFISIFTDSLRGLVAFVVGNVIAFIVYTIFSLTGVTHGNGWFTMHMNLFNATFHLILTIIGAWTISKIKRDT